MTIHFSCLKIQKILEKLKTVTPGEITLQSKHDLICQVAKVKDATLAHSTADFFLRIYHSL